MSKDLKKRGFTFVGSTICYAFMQATGMVNDHAVECFRYRLRPIAKTANLRHNNGLSLLRRTLPDKGY